MKRILSVIPMYEISMLVAVPIIYLTTLLFIIPTTSPVIPYQWFGDAVIIHSDGEQTILKNKWGMLLMVGHGMDEYYMGSTWTIGEIGGENSIERLK